MLDADGNDIFIVRHIKLAAHLWFASVLSTEDRGAHSFSKVHLHRVDGVEEAASDRAKFHRFEFPLLLRFEDGVEITRVAELSFIRLFATHG